MSAIIAYADRYRLDPDTLKRIIWKVDRVLLAHWKSMDAADKRKREEEARLQREQHKQAGGRS